MDCFCLRARCNGLVSLVLSVSLICLLDSPGVQLCQIGYPWQYKQPSLFKSKLWVANFVLRTLILSKLLPKVFGQQV